MANPGLLTALGALGTGLSTYGQVRREKDALARALEERDYERSRLSRMESIAAQDRQRAIQMQDAAAKRQAARDILDAVMGGLRPQGMQSLELGGQQFQLPEVLTPNEQIAARARRYKLAFPQLNEAQAELLARQELRPGEVIVDPGTARPPRTTTTTITPPVTGMDTFIQAYKRSRGIP